MAPASYGRRGGCFHQHGPAGSPQYEEDDSPRDLAPGCDASWAIRELGRAPTARRPSWLYRPVAGLASGAGARAIYVRAAPGLQFPTSWTPAHTVASGFAGWGSPGVGLSKKRVLQPENSAIRRTGDGQTAEK